MLWALLSSQCWQAGARLDVPRLARALQSLTGRSHPADRTRGAGLPLESAILHGKLEQHEEALHILVHELADFPAAEDYCLWRSEGRDPPYRQRLFHLLLAVYLGPGPAAPTRTVAAVDLLNRHAVEFDAAQVLQLLPGTWSVQLLRPFLMGAMRDSIHARRTTQVAVGLARSENLIYKYDKVRARPSWVRRLTLMLTLEKQSWSVFFSMTSTQGMCGLLTQTRLWEPGWQW